MVQENYKKQAQLKREISATLSQARKPLKKKHPQDMTPDEWAIERKKRYPDPV